MNPSFTSYRRSILLAGTIGGLFLAACRFRRRPRPLSARDPPHAPAAAPAAARIAARLAADRPSRRQRSRRQARAGRRAAARRPPPTSCRPPSSSCRRASTSRSMPRASPMRARCASATRARVFVGTRLGNKVSAVVKKDGKTEVKAIAEGLYRPNGLAYHKGTLYIAELSQISKIENVEDNLDKVQQADGDLHRSAEGRGPRLEVHRHRPGQEALRPGRPARQQRAA